MDFSRTLISFLSLSFAWALASSIGSEFESSLTCSKFHFEEKVLEKLVRLEHTMQNVEEKMNMWENAITSKLDEMKIIKKQTETFVQSIQDAQLQEQTQFNKSYQDIVQQFKTQAGNETVFYGDQMNTLLESLSPKIKLFTEAEEKRESVKELMHSSLQKEQKRLNSSYNQIVDLFKVNSNKALQELILKQEQGYAEMVNHRNPIAFSAYRSSSQSLTSGTKVLFSQVWTNVGNGYEPSTGIFTAPRTGLYHITAVVMSPSGRNLSLRLYRNKSMLSGSYLNGRDYNTGTFDVILSLQKRDEVYIAGYGSYTIYSDSGKHITFSGHIIM
ncbi:Hypothetical predicted protein [Mytilus galloprovincialis]|uniref:C1q domain-containing protein n=1 Tax=Mytilus galloprovincialis TaxID=29158 RepID=A0A8B6GL56_MYTGA|nr:Hypothetical predicted protein [Mytilus galloprovincialis]